MAEALVGDVIERHFDDELGHEGFPLVRPLRAPATWSSGRSSGKTRWLDQRFELGHERLALVCGKSGREPDVMEQPVAIVQAEQERTDHFSCAGVTETAHNAIRG